MTVAGWVRPEARATQYLVRKGTQNTVDGYELSLANGGTAFVRFNQATSGNTYRIDSTSAYPTNGSTWMHLAATYDGTTMRLYVNGAQQAAAPGPPGGIATNTQPFIVGAQLNTSGTPERFFKGAMDDLHLHNRALSATEIAQLATPGAPAPTDPPPDPEDPTNQPPVIEPIGDQKGIVGETASLQVDGSDPDGDKLTYDATGLPPGLSIGSATGAITGTLAAAGTFAVKVTASDGDLSASTEFAWEVAPAPGITYAGASAGANRTEDMLILTTPTSAAPGDVLLASVDATGAPTVTAPAGWTLVRSDASGAAMSKHTYVRVVSTSTPSEHVWRFGTAVGASGTMAAYRGVDAAAPIVAHGGRATASGTTVTAPSITTNVGDTMLVGFYGVASNGSLAPVDMNGRADASSGGRSKVTSLVADQARAETGSTGDRRATTSKSGGNVGHLIALRPQGR
jgi:hypothetical protein